MAKMIKLKIDGIEVSVPEGSTVLDAAKKANISIQTLCFLKEINAIGACRMCLVEIKNVRPLVTACVYPAADGMEVTTHSPRIIKSRKTNLELLLSNHNRSCLSCRKSDLCKLRRLSHEYGCDERLYDGAKSQPTKDESSVALVRDGSKCILCKRCVAACRQMQTVDIIAVNKRGFESTVGCAFEEPIRNTACVGCGQCTLVCPTGALLEKDDSQVVFKALNNPELTIVVAPAPSVRVTLGEEFGYPIGTNVEKKMITALRLLGFKHVFDVDFAADLTIMEEATEFLQRVKDPNAVLPMMTSCSPGWVNFLTAYYPDMIGNLSTAKSPMQMQGSMTKTYWAQKMNIDPKKIFTVHIMPCTAKKTEIMKNKDALIKQGIKDTDAVLTVRELARMLKQQGILLPKLADGQFDHPLGESSGAGTIFGATGGVMEAALRTAADILENKSLTKIDYKKVRGIKGIKEATLDIAGMKINVCVASGLANARQVLDSVKSGKKKYHFIEIMCCPGGCVNGGGTPFNDYDELTWQEIATKRAKGLYNDDAKDKYRKSHDNPSIIKIYKEFLDKPGSHKAHELLHNSYDKRKFI